MKMQTIEQIREKIRQTPVRDYPKLREQLLSDERKGVAKLLLQMQKSYDKYRIENERILNMKKTEQSLHDSGYRLVAGTDEVGRGPLCGPVVSAVVIMPEDSFIAYVNDSKQLSEKKREELYASIMQEAIDVGIGVVDNTEIDRINILNATKESMVRALKNLKKEPDILLLDAITIPYDIEQKSFIRGDANVYCIAAASIVAKVTRDRMMVEYDKKYPFYHLASNKGYGSREHMEAIRKYGITPIHRKSFLHFTASDVSSEHNPDIYYKNEAVRYLQNKQYAIIQLDYTCPNGTIDIIAKDGDTLVIIKVETVKTQDFLHETNSIPAKEMRSIIECAENFLMKNNTLSPVRFDVLSVNVFDTDSFTIHHTRNAFEGDGGNLLML